MGTDFKVIMVFMTGYYTEKLSGRRLQRCYEVAPPRVQQYLEAEILHAVSRLHPTDTVLELGCGYGRIARRLAHVAQHVIGVDTASESIALAQQLREPGYHCDYLLMDALALAFTANAFDAVLCLQNGICAFGIDQESLLREALRVTRDGGTLLCSTYADRFWDHRLAWFEAQAAAEMVGGIDYAASGNGVIVCQDGFRAGRLTPQECRSLCSRFGLDPKITEVDESSVFCEIVRPSFK